MRKVKKTQVEHILDHIIRLHEPHPGNEIKARAVSEIRAQLEERDLI